MTDVVHPAGDLPEPDGSGFVDVNRTRLRVWWWGDPADPPVVLAHGAYDHGRLWDDFAPRLVGLGLRPVAVDLRGHGDSGRHASGMVWTASALDLCELARVVARAPGEPVGMIGHSMGGGQVLSAAATTPERIAWVVNLDGLGPPAEAFEEPPPVDAAADALDRIDRLLGRDPRIWSTRREMAQRRGEINRRLPQRFLDHLVEHGTEAVAGGFVWKTDPIFSTGIPNGFDLDEILASYTSVTVPVLALVSSEEDAWTEVHDEEAARRVDHLPDGRWYSVPDAGHYVHVERPDFVIARVGEFLAELGGAPVTPPLTELLVVHDLGGEGGAPWHDAFHAWPGPVLAPDLPGHGTAPAPAGGHYEIGDAIYDVLAVLRSRPSVPRVVVGVGHNGGVAQLLALGGRAVALVLVDGLGGPWIDVHERERLGRQMRRRILETPAALASSDRVPDPRASMVVGRSKRDFAVRQAESMPVPTLIVESPMSPTPDAEDLTARHPDAALVRVTSRAPDVVADAVRGWWSALER